MAHITVEMLKMVWGKNMYPECPDCREYTDNRVDLIHPNGWIFELGKFRTRPCRDYFHVRMHIMYWDDKEYKSFDNFAKLFFGVDLDSCFLDDLYNILEWCDENTVAQFIKTVESTKTVYKK